MESEIKLEGGDGEAACPTTVVILLWQMMYHPFDGVIMELQQLLLPQYKYK